MIFVPWFDFFFAGVWGLHDVQLSELSIRQDLQELKTTSGLLPRNAVGLFFFSLPGHQKCELSQDLDFHLFFSLIRQKCENIFMPILLFVATFSGMNCRVRVLKSRSPIVSPRVDDP